MLVATTDATGTTVNFTKPTATDNEDPNPVVTCDPGLGLQVRRRHHHGHLHRA